MAKKNKELIEAQVNAVLTVDTTLLNAAVDGLAKQITTSFSTAALKSVEGFVKKLRNSIQISFDDTVIGSLKSPIKITLDTKDASNKIKVLGKELEKIAIPLANIAKAEKAAQEAKKAQRIIDDAAKQKAKSKSPQGIIFDDVDAKKSEQAALLQQQSALINRQREKVRVGTDLDIKAAREEALREARKLQNSLSIQTNAQGLFSDADVAKLEKNINKQKQLFVKAVGDVLKTRADLKKSSDDLAKEETRLKGIFNPSEVNKSKLALDKLHDELEATIKTITKSGVPITTVTKQTSSYDRSIINLRRDLENINKEFKNGNITLAQAARSYEKVNSDIRKLGVGINQIDGTRIKKAFTLEEVDPKSLGIRFAGLGFTLGAVSNALLNFSRNTVQVFTNLAQVAEPIERVSNSLDLLVKNGQLTLEQKASTLETLREIGDLPGSTVETANQTFEQLKRINLTLSERLELTRGLAKLPATTGGVAKDTNQLANALTKAASGGRFEGQQFTTVLEQGGETVKKLNERLGIGSAEDINDIGVLKYIRLLSQELSGLESPALTTTDRINKLKSRFSEFGVIFGTLVAPALDSLNTFLRNTLQPALEAIGKEFKKLSPTQQSVISKLILAIPLITGLIGSLTAALVVLNFTISSVANAAKILPIVGAKFGIGSAAKILAGGAAATTATSFATLPNGLVGPVGIAGLAGGAAGPVAVAGLAGSATAGAVGGTAAVGTLTKITSLVGNLFKFLPKILGLTNPIGISINLLLSGVLAFFQNFNGVKDRLLSSLQKLDAPINKLLKAFGLEEGGLAQILGYIGTYISKNFEVLGVVLSTIGGIIVEVASSIIQTFTNIIDGIANIVNSLKNGSFTDALKSFFKLLYDLTIGFLVNLGINLVSLLLDAIASAIEAAFGEGVVGGIIRSAANSLRGLNGTDAESTAVSTREQKQKESDKRIQAERLKQQEELNQLSIQQEQDRIDKLKLANLEVVALLKKSREEFVKFQLDQKVEGLKVDKEKLSQKTQDVKDFSKRGLELATTTGDTALISSLISQRLDQTKKQQIDIENQISNINVLGVINKALSREGELKPFFEAVDAGSQELKPLVDILEKVRNSPSIAEALKILSQTVPVAQKIELSSAIQIGSDATTQQRLNLSGLTDRFRNIVAQSSIEVDKSRIEIEKIENQNKKNQQEITTDINNTNEEIRKQEIKREDDRKKYLQEQKRLLEDINIEVEKEGRGESKVLDEVNQLNDAIKEGKKDRIRQNKDLLDGIDKEIKEINDFREAKRKEITDDTFISDEDEATLLKILDNTSTKKLNDLEKERKEREKGFAELDKAYDKLNQSKGNSLLVKFYKDIFDQLRNIANLSVDTLAKFGDTLAKFSTAFKSSGGTGGIKDVEILKQELNRLVKREGLSELSSGYLELRDVIISVERGTLNVSKATEKFIEILAKLKAQPQIDAFNQQLKDTNIAIANAFPSFSKRTFIGPDQEDNNEIANKILPGAPTTRAGVANIIGNFIPADKSPKEILNRVSEFLKNNETLSIDLKEELQKTIDSSSATELNAGFFDSVLQLFVRVAGTSEESFKEFLKQAFGFNFNQALAIQQSIKLYQAKINKDAAINQSKIEETLRQIENKQRNDLDINNQQIAEAESKLLSLDDRARFAPANELIRIRKQQAAIKVQLIDFNFQRLDIETAYNIQKDIIQANENEIEIARIKKDGTAKRKALLEERNKDIIAAVQEGGGNTDKFGNPVDANGNRINISVPKILSGTGDFGTEQETNTTVPTINLTPELTKTEQLTAVLKSINDDLNGVGNAARNAGNGVLELFNRLASGEGVINVFKDAIGGMKFDLQSLTEVFAATAEFGITAFADALGKAVADTLVNGGNFLKNLGKFFGDTLIMLGTQLLQIGIAAAVLATLGTFFPVLRPLTGGPEGFYAAGVASALGIGMILLGKAMGGGGGKAAATTSNTGASNSANSSAGNSGQVEYDPEKDPKLIYQKALRTEVYIDIKRDDGSIVKSIVRQVNRNPAFANLIGNGRTGFVL